ncbi:erythromycin esterase family protein [Flavobacterium sp. W1B]|uniref:erythromycin esterase family protein n=1 Tax=Flavobacterium sp. W1B TaxID=3394146 RepID=UPI0039BD0527
MNKKVLYIFLNLLCLNVNAQNFNPKTLTLPENPTSQDFSFLKEELKDVQVVMLGERTHFDGNVFEIKTEIIKYLNQELGFNTIAFESGVYDVWKAQNNINNSEKTKIAFEKSLFSIWSKTNEFQSFITFFDKNKSTLKLFGFDNQITGEYGRNELIKDLFSYCNQNQLTLKLNNDDFELLIESIDNSGVFDESDITYEKYKSSLTNLLNNISKKPKEEIHFYWSQIIKNLLTIGEDSYNKKEPILSIFNTTSDDNIRDKQMADNLLEYIKYHPNEKIICWGANVHFVNDISSVKTSVIKEYIPMGSFIKKELKEKVYSLASVTAADSIYLNKNWSKTPINKDSFEEFLKNKNKPLLFISSKQDEMKKIQFNRLFSPIDFIEARLDLLHDGYLYFNHVKQATSIEDEENEVQRITENDSSLTTAEKQETKTSKKTTTSEVINLEEVFIVNYSKKFTYSIISKAIENINKNYPTNSFNSQQNTNIDVKVKNETVTNIDFRNIQYDRGYDQIDRNSKKLTEVKWNIKNDYVPKSIREFRSLSYNNPIMYGSCLNSRKSKKFVYKINEIKVYNDKKVYVIRFSIPRNHYTYTKRSIPSDYSGILYINQDDFSIVKIIENWEYKENPEPSEYDTYGWNEKYTTKEIHSEIVETNFEKINDLYYLTSSEIEISGKLVDKEKNQNQIKIYIDSNWSNFKTVNPIKISYKEEQNLFDK